MFVVGNQERAVRKNTWMTEWNPHATRNQDTPAAPKSSAALAARAT